MDNNTVLILFFAGLVLIALVALMRAHRFRLKAKDLFEVTIDGAGPGGGTATPSQKPPATAGGIRTGAIQSGEQVSAHVVGNQRIETGDIQAAKGVDLSAGSEPTPKAH